MSQIQPEGEEIRKAIKWISDNLNEGKKKSKLVEEADLDVAGAKPQEPQPQQPVHAVLN